MKISEIKGSLATTEYRRTCWMNRELPGK